MYMSFGMLSMNFMEWSMTANSSIYRGLGKTLFLNFLVSDEKVFFCSQTNYIFCCKKLELLNYWKEILGKVNNIKNFCQNLWIFTKHRKKKQWFFVHKFMHFSLNKLSTQTKRKQIFFSVCTKGILSSEVFHGTKKKGFYFQT